MYAIVAPENGDGVRLASLAACIHLAAAGAEPVLSLLTRDLNRIALESNVVGAVNAGADFVITQPVFDLKRFGEWMTIVRDRDIHTRTRIIASVMPIGLPDGSRRLDIPAELMERLRTAGDRRTASVHVATEAIEAVRKTEGVRVVHDESSDRHITDAVRELHLAFVERGNRDEITIIAGGGISMAEHVAKTILCGADLVAIDVPLMIALECRVCMNCTQGLTCPIDLAEVEHHYAVQRMVNLMGAWHSQLLEMMGAMGIREIRRLRGQLGRAMFFDDLERECFGPIFGARRPDAEMTAMLL